jgi:hypothetical protein
MENDIHVYDSSVVPARRKRPREDDACCACRTRMELVNQPVRASRPQKGIFPTHSGDGLHTELSVLTRFAFHAHARLGNGG